MAVSPLLLFLEPLGRWNYRGPLADPYQKIRVVLGDGTEIGWFLRWALDLELGACGPLARCQLGFSKFASRVRGVGILTFLTPYFLAPVGRFNINELWGATSCHQKAARVCSDIALFDGRVLPQRLL